MASPPPASRRWPPLLPPSVTTWSSPLLRPTTAAPALPSDPWAVPTTLGETVDGRLQVELRETEDELDAGTDTALVVAGYVAVTPLIGIRAAVDVELDAAAAVEEALGLSPAAS